jgi:hypothetical protein
VKANPKVAFGTHADTWPTNVPVRPILTPAQQPALELVPHVAEPVAIPLCGSEFDPAAVLSPTQVRTFLDCSARW